MSFKTDPFYNDMANIKSGNISIQEYISEKFGNFWQSFDRYLTFFHKPINQNRFLRKPKLFLTDCFESITKILQKTTIENYNEDMKPYISNCFKSMLHPDNADFIKQSALDLFMIIYPILNRQTAINYTEDFEKYFFDFSFIDNKLKITTIDNECRIQLSDQDSSKPFKGEKLDGFLSSIYHKYFKTDLNNNETVLWWRFIKQYIIGVVFYSILSRKPTNTGISNIENVQLEIEKIIINFLLRITKSNILKIILPVDDSTDYITDIINYLSQESLISKINSVDFVYTFLQKIFESHTNIGLIEIFYKHDYHLIFKLIGSLIDCLNYAFNVKPDLVPEMTKLLNSYLITFFQNFNEHNFELIESITNYQRITNSNCLLHFVSFVLSFFVQQSITEKKFWQILTKSIANSSNKRLLLIAFSHFAGYFSSYVFHELLNLDPEKLSRSLASISRISQFLDLRNLLWQEEFTGFLNLNYQEMFLEQRKQLMHAVVLRTPGITGISLQELFSIQKFPSKEEILALLRVMFSTFNWEINSSLYENDELAKFYCYLIDASFITPLIKISNVISPDVSFGRNFLISEFLPFLFNCLKSTVSNLNIKLHALVMLGNIICWKSSLTALNEKTLANWYLILNDFIISGGDNKVENNSIKEISDLKLKIKLSALTFACKSILIGFKGPSILLKTIIDNFDLLKLQNEELLCSTTLKSTDRLSSFLIDGGYETLTSVDAASLLVSLSNIIEISDNFSFNCYKSDDNVDIRAIKDELKYKLIVNFVGLVDVSLRASTIISVLNEEAEANRNNSKILDKLLNLIFEYFYVSSPEYIYADTTLTLILPELEKVKPGSVALILEKAIDALDKYEISSKKDELLFGRFAEFVVDHLIYSSFIINTEYQLKLLTDVVKKWNLTEDNSGESGLKNFDPATKQRIQYALLSLSAHYLRFPPSTPSFSMCDKVDSLEENVFSCLSDSKLPAATFGSSKDCIIRVSDKDISSLLPVGKYTWNYKSIAPPPVRRKMSDDVSISESVSKASEHPTQIEFTNRFENFIDNLYSNNFVEISEDENNNKDDIFEVCHSHLYSPRDFDTSLSPSFEPSLISDVKLRQEKLPPHSVGPKSAAFMSSLNFFDSQVANRLFTANKSYNYVGVSEFRHVIHVGFVPLESSFDDPHFKDFKCGLGLLDEKEENEIYADSRHQIVFHLNQEKAKNADVFVCWGKIETTEDWINTFNDHDNKKIRIEIQPTHYGLFLVTVLVKKNYFDNELACLSNVLVSKNNLPEFVISQILINVHNLDFYKNATVRIQLKNGNDIREKREKEFLPYSILLNCEKSLLTLANSNDFSADETK